MTNINFYKILGCNKDTDSIALKIIYRKLCNLHHPDKGGDEEQFKLIQLAYSVLSDPERRGQYDRNGTWAKSAQSEDKQLQAELVQCFMQIVEQADELHNVDIKESMRRSFQQQTSTVRAQHLLAKRSLNKFIKLSKQIIYDNKGKPNYLLSRIEDTILQLNNELEVLRKRLVMLTELRLEVDYFNFNNIEEPDARDWNDVRNSTFGLLQNINSRADNKADILSDVFGQHNSRK